MTLYYYKKLNYINNIKTSLQINKKKQIFKVYGVWGSIFFIAFHNLFVFQKKFHFITKKRNFLNTQFNFISNFLRGTQLLYNTDLKINGLGFKTILHNNLLLFKLGFSHLTYIYIPIYIKLTVSDKFTNLKLWCVDLECLKNFCYLLYTLKKPEPYKGKGICFKNSKLKLKLIKKI